MRRGYDAIVVGGGLLGAATAYALSRNKKNSVLLIEAREKGHADGSSHGHSRIIRTVASESAQFGAMAKESFERMQELNRPDRFVAGPVDALFMSFTESPAFKTLAAQNSEPVLGADEIFERWGIHLPRSGVGTVDKLSGILDPATLLDIFYEEVGDANIRWRIPVNSWHADSAGVTVTTTDAETYRAAKLVLAAGAWLPSLLANGTVDDYVRTRLSGVRVERIPLFYFDYPAGMPPVIPVTLLQNGHPDMYAMPEFDGPVASPTTDGPRYLKVGFHKGTAADSPENVDRTIHPDEKRHALNYMKENLGLDLTLDHTGVCLYAMPPDLRESKETESYNELPLLGDLPGTPSVLLAAYGAGICAKHALVIGEEICSLVNQRQPRFDLMEFDPSSRLRVR